MKKVILLILILLLLLSLVGCKVAEPGYNFATDKDTFSSEGNMLIVKVISHAPYTFDLADYDYSLNSEIALKVRNLQTNEIWRFPYYTIQYLRIIE